MNKTHLEIIKEAFDKIDLEYETFENQSGITVLYLPDTTEKVFISDKSYDIGLVFENGKYSEYEVEEL